MKHETMTPEQMISYIKNMDATYGRLTLVRDRILEEVKAIQDRKEILSWEEVASAVAYPKAASDQERCSNGNPDDYKLLHQAERIQKIYRSQIEDLFTELENVETQISKYRYIDRCISFLEPNDKAFINQFTRKNLTYAQGVETFHIARSSIYKFQKLAVENLVKIYNRSC